MSHSDQLTNLLRGAQTVATRWEEALSDKHKEGTDVSEFDFPASFVGQRDSGEIGIVPLAEFQNDKQKLAEVLIPAAIRAHHFVRCILTFTAWMHTDINNPTIPASQHPDRKEIYFISGYENGHSVFVTAEVDRSGPVPKLLSWEPVTDGPLLGNFPEPILETLKEVDSYGFN